MSGIPTDIATWYTSIPALAGVVAAFVALIRKHFAAIDGKVVIALSVVIGLLLAYGGHILGFLGGDWLIFGVMAGLTASGGVDLVRGFTNGNTAKGAAAKRRPI